MQYFDTTVVFTMGAGEVELPATFGYTYYPGYAGSREEPPEPSEVEIVSMSIEGIAPGLCDQFREVLETDDIEIEIEEHVKDAAEAAAEDYAVSQYEDRKWREEQC